LLKGHRDFGLIVTARFADGKVVLLGVLPGRKKKTVANFPRSIPERLKSTIHSACCDMYEGYTEALSEEWPVECGANQFPSPFAKPIHPSTPPRRAGLCLREIRGSPRRR
ncbi:MAG: transposase, partial [Chloroflexi bacterium]|nr:transposase [Chloroflexota bacterium]